MLEIALFLAWLHPQPRPQWISMQFEAQTRERAIVRNAYLQQTSGGTATK